MLAHVRAHFMRQPVAYLALFVALGGTSAYAANTINSGDIVDGQVKSVDVGDNEIKSLDVLNNSLRAADIAANQVGTSEIEDGAVSAGDVRNNSLTGVDIDESLLALDEPTAPAYAHIVNGQVDAQNSKNVTVHQVGTGYQCLTAAWDYNFEVNGEIHKVTASPDAATAQIDVGGADTRDRVGLTFERTAVDRVCDDVYADVLVYQVTNAGAAATLPYYIIFT